MNNEKTVACIEKHHAMIFRVALGYVKNTQDAEDICQNTFFKHYTRKRDFASKEAEKAWLIRVAINEAKNLLKSTWFKKRTDLDESLVAPVDEDLDLYEYVKRLKPKYRTVIYLYYYEGYTAKEFAEILKRPQATIETQLKRSREYLKEMIEKEESDYSNRLCEAI